MKKSTKYAMVGIIGGMSCLGGSISIYAYGKRDDKEEYVIKQKIQDAEYKKNTLSKNLEYCLEDRQNDCRALFSEYKAVDAQYLALKKESEKKDVPVFSALIMIGGLALAYFSLEPYFKSKRKEEYNEYREKCFKALQEADASNLK